MFESFSQSIRNTINMLSKNNISEQEIQTCLDKIYHELINADTSEKAAENFINYLKKELKNIKPSKGINHEEQIYASIHNALCHQLGKAPEKPITSTRKPSFIMLLGLQGAGKTTTAVKLAKRLIQETNKRIAVTSLDYQRHAAQEQLKIFAEQNSISYIQSTQNNDWKKTKEDLVLYMQHNNIDSLIIDTAGRLDIDQKMMDEIKAINTTFNPENVVFVMDSQAGQKAYNIIEKFHQNIPNISGSILTKCDADSKAGVALSMRMITNKPILFMGTGEKANDLEVFNADKIANKMLDLGDIAGLVKKIQDSVDEAEAKKQSERLMSGKYNFNDFLQQIHQLKKMGGIAGIMQMLPGIASMPQNIKEQINDDQFKIIETLINSMTKKEREYPDLIINMQSRQKRVIKGSGQSKENLNQLLKQFKKLKDAASKFSPSKLQKMMDMIKKQQQ